MGLIQVVSQPRPTLVDLRPRLNHIDLRLGLARSTSSRADLVDQWSRELNQSSGNPTWSIFSRADSIKLQLDWLDQHLARVNLFETYLGRPSLETNLVNHHST